MRLRDIFRSLKVYVVLCLTRAIKMSVWILYHTNGEGLDKGLTLVVEEKIFNEIIAILKEMEK